MARPIKIKNKTKILLQISKNDVEYLADLAALESAHTGRIITTQELIRGAIVFVYHDAERLREAFRRSRNLASRMFKKKC